MVERIRAALAAARAVRSLEHTGVKGTIREVLISDLFRPLLPSDVGVTSGVVISSFDDRQSRQQDIIIFDQRILPPLLFEHGPAIVPVESAMICIEVKSTLTASELRAANESAKTVRELDLASGHRDSQTGQWVETANAFGVGAILLALDSDLSFGGQTEINRYKAVLDGDYPFLSGLCVAGRSSWWQQEPLSYKMFKEGASKSFGTWHEVQSDGNHAELLHLIAGAIQMIQRLATARGQPPLDSYFR